MAIEYILFADFGATPSELRDTIVRRAEFSRDEDFRDFSCASAVGVQLLSGAVHERVFSGSLQSQVWSLSPKQDIFFTLDKNEHYHDGKVNMVKAVLDLLKTFDGDVVLVNNENREYPVLMRAQGKLWLTTHPGSGFWDQQYEPDVLSLVDIPFDLADIHMIE